MPESGSDLDLTEKTVGPKRVGELCVEHFDSDGTAVTAVLSEVYRRHTSATELALERVAALQGICERGTSASHGIVR
jgi:hypothetical protein